MNDTSPENQPATSTSEGSGSFPLTMWEVVRAAAEGGDKTSFVAISSLCERYREPLLVFARSLVGADQAEDFLQGFLVRMVDPSFYARIKPERGRFRSFLRVCLKNYVADQIDKQKAQRRGGDAQVQSMQETDEGGHPMLELAADTSTPDLDFDRAWAKSVLERSLGALNSENQGHRRDRFLAARDILTGEGPEIAYAELAQRVGMTEGSFRVLVHRLKKRLRAIVEEEVRATVASAEDAATELDYLVSLWSASPPNAHRS